MKVHEYQAKEILRRYGVPTPRGEVVESPDEARVAAKQLGGRVVVKAQIHAGGRGKGGGVKLAKDADEAAELTKKMIGMTLVTHQTGPEGRVVHKVLIEEALNIDRELYLGITLDRRIGMPVIMASQHGGVAIDGGGGRASWRQVRPPSGIAAPAAASRSTQSSARSRFSRSGSPSPSD